MGLTATLPKQLIEYGSPESVEFTSIYFMPGTTGPWLSQTISRVNVVSPSTTLKNQTMLTEPTSTSM